MRYAVIALGVIALIFGLFMILQSLPWIGGILSMGMFGILGIVLGISLVLIGVKLREIQY
jgi:hypothetical protein